MPAEFHFVRPQWLWLLLPLLLLLWRLASRRNDSQAWSKLIDPHLLPHMLVNPGGRQGRWPLALLAVGWLLGVLAAAGPTWERLPQPVFQPQQYRVLLLDLSSSMNTADVSPSRLTHARFEVLDLLRLAGEGQTALVAYADEPYIVSPLTGDAATIAAQVPSLNTELLPWSQGKRTDLALRKAAELLQQAGAPEGDLILVTDGVEHPAAAAEVARELAGEGYRVSVLGVGTLKGAPVPGRSGFATDANGAIRVSRLDVDALSTLATAGRGRYRSAVAGDADAQALMSEAELNPGLGLLEQHLQAEKWDEQGPWLLLALLPLAALAFRRGWFGPLLLVLVIQPMPEAHALSWDELWLNADQRAFREFEAGQAQQAAELFERQDWQAAAEYQAGNYQQALTRLGDRPGVTADYNRGNTLARMGKYQQALDAYDSALEADPEHADARFNRDLIARLMQQDQQPQSQQQDQQQDGQDGDDSEQQQSSQGGEDEQDPSQSQQGQQQDSQNAKGGQQQEDQQADQATDPEGGGEDAQEQQAQADEGEQDEGEAAARQPPEDAEERTELSGSEPSPQEGRHADQANEQQQAWTGQSEPDEGQSAAQTEQQQQGQRGFDPAEAESEQALQQALRLVEDDPAGLLRQRFILQYYRRHGQLPPVVQ